MADDERREAKAEGGRNALALVSLLLALPMCVFTSVVVLNESAAERPWYITRTISLVPMIILVVLGLLSAVSAAAGAVALRRVARSDSPRYRADIAGIGLFLGVVGVLALALLLKPVMDNRVRAIGHARQSNIKSIGLALLMYSRDYNAQLPPRLQMLVDGGYCEASRFASPVSREEARLLNPHDVDAAGYYVYARTLDDTVPPDVPLMWERLFDHESHGCVLFVNSSGRWIQRTELRRLIEEYSSYYLKPPPLPPGEPAKAKAE